MAEQFPTQEQAQAATPESALESAGPHHRSILSFKEFCRASDETRGLESDFVPAKPLGAAEVRRLEAYVFEFESVCRSSEIFNLNPEDLDFLMNIKQLREIVEARIRAHQKDGAIRVVDTVEEKKAGQRIPTFMRTFMLPDSGSAIQNLDGRWCVMTKEIMQDGKPRAFYGNSDILLILRSLEGRGL